MYVASRIEGWHRSTQFCAVGISDTFANHDDHMLLQLIQLHDPRSQLLQIDRYLRDQNNVWLSVCGTQCNVSGLTPHDFDDCHTAMTFRRSSQTFNALGNYEDCSRIARRRVVNDVFQFHRVACAQQFFAILRGPVKRVPNPFIGFVDVIQPQIIVNRFRCQDARQNPGNRLHAVDRAVATDADQSIELEFVNMRCDKLQKVFVCLIKIGTR